MAYKWDFFQSAIHSPQRNSFFPISQYPGIIGNCSQRYELSFCFPAPFISICNFTDTPGNHLCRKMIDCPYLMIGLVMDFVLVTKLFVQGNFRDGITGRIGLLNCFKQGFSLVFRGQQLYFQGKLHKIRLTIYLKVNPAISNTPSVPSFRGVFRFLLTLTLAEEPA